MRYNTRLVQLLVPDLDCLALAALVLQEPKEGERENGEHSDIACAHALALHIHPPNLIHSKPPNLVDVVEENRTYREQTARSHPQDPPVLGRTR